MNVGRVLASKEGEDMNRPVNNAEWLEQMEVAKEWVTAKGFTVVEDTDLEDKIVYWKKRIYLNSRKHAQSRFYTLLHECGHLLVDQTADKFQQDHPMYAQTADGRVARSAAYRVSLVAEEIEAWKRGRRLAARLGLFVDDAKYDAQMTQCLMSYINWAADE
jgi:hypothetical protein